ncbi:MAG: ATP-binding protein [Desulforhabdus sp.]|jgi:PAS domain S-box-containing protein|nr:ATP-binding protein [Desulforhabdus sp.]
MLSPTVVLTAVCLYLGFLILIALWVERRTAEGKSPANNPFVYSLSLAVYCTAWTYYGSVGKAATSGILFLPIYLGPTVFIALWWIVLRKMVRLKNAYRITSIADFISARYKRSQPVAAIASIVAIVGILPYIALQLKAIISTFSMVTAQGLSDPTTSHVQGIWLHSHVGIIIVALLTAFTIILGVRRLDPTERHEGMMMALAVECVVKLVAFLAAGCFVTYFLFDGFADLFEQFAASSLKDTLTSWADEPSGYFTWMSYFILSMSAILFLPRQFHVAVVENSDERHILTAMWLFPLYMLLINIFVFPIALGGLLMGYAAGDADRFVLLLPMRYVRPWLTLLVFIGGFSAAAGMIMIASVTLATMTTNHLLLPLVEWVNWLNFMKRHLLKCRWAAVAGLILLGYGFEEWIFQPYMLVSIGLISFAAVLQFAPAILGGIFWRRANTEGAILGLSAGFLVWCYTQMLPSFVRNGWLSSSLLEAGPWGIGLLKPEQMFGIEGLDPLSHTVLWSMLFNVGFYFVGSLFFQETNEERSLAEDFVGALNVGPPMQRTRHREAYINLEAKKTEIVTLLAQYFADAEATAVFKRSLGETGIREAKQISIEQLVDLHGAVEKYLAGAIGSAAAHKAMQQGTVFSPRERQELTEVYGEILADLKVSPTELKSKIDYYQERESLLMDQARELEEKVRELEREIGERKRIQSVLREREARYRELVETMNEGLELEDDRGIITYVNDKLCEMWGRARDEIIGRKVEDFIDRSQLNMLLEKMSSKLTGEIQSYEATWENREGQKISTLVSTVPILDEQGSLKGSFSVITDISQLKMLEREKANLVSMFAHDMRSSLTGIHGLGLRLFNKSDSLDDEKKMEYLRIINQEAAKLEALVDDFLEFSRLEVGKLKLNFRAVSLDKELLELFEAYRLRASMRGLNLEFRIEDPLPIIEADLNRLRRVFTNLLDNALKFSTEHGTIKMTSEETDDEIIVRISDDGVGIDARELPYIFDLFHRGQHDQKKDGYGVGLATVKAVVEGHGGRVQVTSELGKGSVFSVFLPKPRKTHRE